MPFDVSATAKDAATSAAGAEGAAVSDPGSVVPVPAAGQMPSARASAPQRTVTAVLPAKRRRGSGAATRCNKLSGLVAAGLSSCWNGFSEKQSHAY